LKNGKLVTDETVKGNLQGLVRLVHGSGHIPLSGDKDKRCEELAEGCVGDHFIAEVRTKEGSDGKSYQNFFKKWAMDDPPKGFIAAASAADFTA